MLIFVKENLNHKEAYVKCDRISSFEWSLLKVYAEQVNIKLTQELKYPVKPFNYEKTSIFNFIYAIEFITFQLQYQ